MEDIKGAVKDGVDNNDTAPGEGSVKQELDTCFSSPVVLPLPVANTDEAEDIEVALGKDNIDSKEQTKPNNSAETGAEAEYSASYKGSRTVINNYSASVKPKPN